MVVLILLIFFSLYDTRVTFRVLMIVFFHSLPCLSELAAHPRAFAARCYAECDIVRQVVCPSVCDAEVS